MWLDPNGNQKDFSEIVSQIDNGHGFLLRSFVSIGLGKEASIFFKEIKGQNQLTLALKIGFSPKFTTRSRWQMRSGKVSPGCRYTFMPIFLPVPRTGQTKSQRSRKVTFLVWDSIRLSNLTLGQLRQ